MMMANLGAYYGVPAAVQGLTPQSLFQGGKQGFWLSSRPEHLFTDLAGTSNVAVDGDLVRRRKDLSPNGNDFIIDVDASRPVYRTDGTLHWLEYDGADDYMESVSEFTFMSGNPYLVCAGVRFTGSRIDDYFFSTTKSESGSDPNNSVIHIGARSASQPTIAHWFNDANFSHSVELGVTKVHTTQYKNPGSLYRINRSTVGENLTVPDALDEVGYGRLFTREHETTPVRYMEGRDYGMIMTAFTPTAQEIADIENHIASESGVTLP